MRISTLFFLPTSLSFAPNHPHHVTIELNAIGIFYGTSTGSTEEAAHLIAVAFGDDAAGPFEIDGVQGKIAEEFGKYDALIVSMFQVILACDRL